MIFKKFETIIAIFFILTFLSFTKENAPKIYWTKDYFLQWKDFQGVTPSKTKYSAGSNVGIEADIKFKDEIFTIIVKSLFVKNKSWVIKEDRSDYILKHEQLHFDIAELYARKTKKELLKLTINTHTFYKVVNIKRKELEKLQELYDKETKHSIDRENQAEWNERIAKELIELEDYSDYIMSIKN